MTLTCMERALSLAEEPEVISEVWYNLGHIGLNLGKINPRIKILNKNSNLKVFFHKRM